MQVLVLPMKDKQYLFRRRIRQKNTLCIAEGI